MTFHTHTDLIAEAVGCAACKSTSLASEHCGSCACCSDAATAREALLNGPANRRVLRDLVYKAGASRWPSTASKADLADFLLTGRVPDGTTPETSETQPAPRAATPPPASSDTLADAIAAAIAGRVTAGVDPAQVESIVRREIEAVREELDERITGDRNELTELCRSVIESHVEKTLAERGAAGGVTVVLPERPEPIKLDGRVHALFEELLSTVRAGLSPFLVGPAGSGKTTLAHQVADACGLPFAMLSCTPGLSESWILGRATADGRYLPSEFVSIYEGGGVFLFDECDNADGQTLNLLNAALANGRLPLPSRTDSPFAKRSPDCIIMAAANTFGQGFGDGMYQRSQLDAAFLDRFVGGTFRIDYDTDLEREIAEAHGIAALLPAFWHVRRNVAEGKVRRVVGTRALVALGRLHRSNPDRYPVGFELLARIWEGVGAGPMPWTAEEITKATAGVARSL